MEREPRQINGPDSEINLKNIPYNQIYPLLNYYQIDWSGVTEDRREIYLLELRQRTAYILLRNRIYTISELAGNTPSELQRRAVGLGEKTLDEVRIGLERFGNRMVARVLAGLIPEENEQHKVILSASEILKEYQSLRIRKPLGRSKEAVPPETRPQRPSKTSTMRLWEEISNRGDIFDYLRPLAKSGVPYWRIAALFEREVQGRIHINPRTISDWINKYGIERAAAPKAPDRELNPDFKTNLRRLGARRSISEKNLVSWTAAQSVLFEARITSEIWGQLTELEQAVLEAYYFDYYTKTSIGFALNLSHEAGRLIVDRAFRKVERLMREGG